MLHKHGPFKKFFNEHYEISVFKQPYLESGTLAKKGPNTLFLRNQELNYSKF